MIGAVEDSLVGETCPYTTAASCFCSHILSGIQQGMLRYGYDFFLLKNRASRDTQNPIQKPLLK